MSTLRFGPKLSVLCLLNTMPQLQIQCHVYVTSTSTSNNLKLKNELTLKLKFGTHRPTATRLFIRPVTKWLPPLLYRSDSRQQAQLHAVHGMPSIKWHENNKMKPHVYTQYRTAGFALDYRLYCWRLDTCRHLANTYKLRSHPLASMSTDEPWRHWRQRGSDRPPYPNRHTKCYAV